MSYGSGASSITYVYFVAGEVALLFMNWWRFARRSLWGETLTCRGLDSKKRFSLCLSNTCTSSCPTPCPSLPSPSQSREGPERWATPVKEGAHPPPRNPQAACPPATELSGPCSLNAHFVPLSTGLIDIDSCAQSALCFLLFWCSRFVGDYFQCVALSESNEIWAGWTQDKWQSLRVITVKVTFSRLTEIKVDLHDFGTLF